MVKKNDKTMEKKMKGTNKAMMKLIFMQINLCVLKKAEKKMLLSPNPAPLILPEKISKDY